MTHPQDFLNKVICGDCLEIMKLIPINSVDAIVTDPPYGLSFMGKKWDYDVPSQEIWEEALRVLKPGGYLLAFAGTRTQHRMAVRIEDAGFEIRDMIAWVYGSGFPKSLNIGKAIDKMEGTEYPKNVLVSENGSMSGGNYTRHTREIESEIAKQWEGWGTALKPALEPITVARKPLSEKSVAENVLKWGTGGIDIDGSRVGTETINIHNAPKGTFAGGEQNRGSDTESYRDSIGRFPANLIHDGSDEVVDLFPNTKPSKSAKMKAGLVEGIGSMNLSNKATDFESVRGHDDMGGSAARFFYCAKASKAERNRGLENLESKNIGPKGNGLGRVCETCGVSQLKPELCSCEVKSWVNPQTKNFHPTVKPIALMEYLVRLVSREGAVVLDPFAGSGSTLIACQNLGRKFIGCEMNEEYIKIAEARLSDKKTIQKGLF